MIIADYHWYHRYCNIFVICCRAKWILVQRCDHVVHIDCKYWDHIVTILLSILLTILSQSGDRFKKPACTNVFQKYCTTILRQRCHNIFVFAGVHMAQAIINIMTVENKIYISKFVKFKYKYLWDRVYLISSFGMQTIWNGNKEQSLWLSDDFVECL